MRNWRFRHPLLGERAGVRANLGYCYRCRSGSSGRFGPGPGDECSNASNRMSTENTEGRDASVVVAIQTARLPTLSRVPPQVRDAISQTVRADSAPVNVGQASRLPSLPHLFPWLLAIGYRLLPPGPCRRDRVLMRRLINQWNTGDGPPWSATRVHWEGFHGLRISDLL